MKVDEFIDDTLNELADTDTDARYRSRLLYFDGDGCVVEELLGEGRPELYPATLIGCLKNGYLEWYFSYNDEACFELGYEEDCYGNKIFIRRSVGIDDLENIACVISFDAYTVAWRNLDAIMSFGKDILDRNKIVKAFPAHVAAELECIWLEDPKELEE